MVLLLAWTYSTYDFNLYLDRGHAFDRILLVGLAACVVWRPVFIFPFVLHSSAMARQFVQPIDGYSLAEQLLLARILMLALGQFLLASLAQRSCLGGFVLLLCCLIAAPYWASGIAKRLHHWLWEDEIHLLLPATYANGWLWTFPRGWSLDLGMALTRVFRATGIPGLLARILPTGGLLGTGRFAMAMVAGSRPSGFGGSGPADVVPTTEPTTGRTTNQPAPGIRGRVGLLTGCVQRGLFARVNEATRRVLEVNWFEVVEVPGQGCCGALHAHAGELDGARDLAAGNVSAFGAEDLDFVVVNAAGCGAAMRDYSHLLESTEVGSFSGKVRDISEILAEVGPVVGAPVELSVALDAPCHLLHAQGVIDAPQRMLAAIPGLEIEMLPNADECCGGAGIYGITHPELGGQIGGDKVDEVLACGSSGVATGNPGCMMQIGAGLRMRGSDLPVWHPVELLAESYRRAGLGSGGRAGA